MLHLLEDRPFSTVPEFSFLPVTFPTEACVVDYLQRQLQTTHPNSIRSTCRWSPHEAAPTSLPLTLDVPRASLSPVQRGNCDAPSVLC